MDCIHIKKGSAKRIEKGWPLIQLTDLQKNFTKLPKDWIEFREEKTNRFLGKGYLGQQNKGIGWILTQNPQTNLDSHFFQQLFQRACRARKPLYQQTDTTAFRLFHGEGDGLGGLTIDFYAGYAVFSWYNETLYKKRYFLYEIFQQLDTGCLGIYEKVRFSNDKLAVSQHVAGKKAPVPHTILENGVHYAVYLDEGLMTGIFLDQRELRRKLATGLASGCTVLNTFSYTGAFSVAAAMGGAVETVSVDLAKRSLEKTQEQFQLNHLDLTTNRIIVMDVFEYFRYAARKGLTFDLIILDPPSFARNKKQHFSVHKDYGKLVSAVLPLLKAEGTLIASCNAANLSFSKYEQMVCSAIAHQNRRIVAREKISLPQLDFPTVPKLPETDYLKVLAFALAT